MLEINGQTYETKFNYKFYQRLVDDFGNDKIDGFSRLINLLVDKNPVSLVKGYRYALDSKDLPSEDKVADALDTKGIWDQEDPYGDFYKRLKADGFLRHRLQLLLHSANKDVNSAKQTLASAGKALTKKEREEAEIAVAGYETRTKEFQAAIQALEK